jgi:hypothetical protein
MRILTICGIGDIHWVMLKMESFIEKECKGVIPEITVWNFDGRPRADGFVKRIPFVKFAGYDNEPMGRQQKRLFHEVYMDGSKEVVAGFKGYDYFICVNGSLRIGHSMNNIMPQYGTNWNYKINVDDCTSSYSEPYIIFYFSNHGMFTDWVSKMNSEKIRSFMQQIKGYKLILTGSSWDAPFNQELEDNGVINLCGKTSLDDLFGLIKGASAFVGWCGGNTIVSQHLNTPTLMLWSDYFSHRAFQTNWVDPERLGKVYIPMDVETANNDSLMRNLGVLLERKATMAS